MKNRFYVKIILELHAITCPGVWLCSNGYMEATIKTLGYFFKTGAMEPKFPALCHDQFLMEGYFKSIKCISELEQVLAAESIEITLWQNGRRLAYYVGQLADVMHPPQMPKLSCFHNVNVQILMNTSQAFPGIIAPKLEISARAVIQDRKCSKSTCSMAGSSNHSVLIPHLEKPIVKSKTHCSDEVPKNHQEHRRQQPVCHSKIFGSQLGKSISGNGFQGSKGQANDYCASSKDSLYSRNESRLQSRRISSCSSSTTANSFGISSESSCLSKCSHFLSNPLDTEEHQKHCNICLSYKKAFDPLTSF